MKGKLAKWKSMKISRFTQSHPKRPPPKDDDLMSNAGWTARNSNYLMNYETDSDFDHPILTKSTCRNCYYDLLSTHGVLMVGGHIFCKSILAIWRGQNQNVTQKSTNSQSYELSSWHPT